MRLSVVTLFSLLLAASTAAAPAAVPDPLQYFVGNWSCSTSMGGNTSSSTMNASQWGQWVRMNINGPGYTGVGYMQWDNTYNHWIYSEIDSNGMYFTAQSDSPRIRNSSWTTGYPNMGGGTDIHINGHGSYAVDSTWNQGGHQRSSHMVCYRQ